jgi:hypothetical protein
MTVAPGAFVDRGLRRLVDRALREALAPGSPRRKAESRIDAEPDFGPRQGLPRTGPPTVVAASTKSAVMIGSFRRGGVLTRVYAAEIDDPDVDHRWSHSFFSSTPGWRRSAST